MTDAEKVAAHPLVEAGARAMWATPQADHNLESWEETEPAIRHGFRRMALSAARVILSAEPTRDQVEAICSVTGGVPGAEDGFRAVRASNAALLREIDGSVPATRDVGTQ